MYYNNNNLGLMLCLQWCWSKTPPACCTWQSPRCGTWWTLTTICPWYYCDTRELDNIIIRYCAGGRPTLLTDANDDDGARPNGDRQMHSLAQPTGSVSNIDHAWHLSPSTAPPPTSQTIFLLLFIVIAIH